MAVTVGPAPESRCGGAWSMNFSRCRAPDCQRACFPPSPWGCPEQRVELVCGLHQAHATAATPAVALTSLRSPFWPHQCAAGWILEQAVTTGDRSAPRPACMVVLAVALSPMARIASAERASRGEPVGDANLGEAIVFSQEAVKPGMDGIRRAEIGRRDDVGK